MPAVTLLHAAAIQLQAAILLVTNRWKRHRSYVCDKLLRPLR